ncbi:sensor histidine kinase [Gordonia neofelifaecis]|uniref:Histidine kinase n=1 Tax=Gordonia neofelifaecis NRRL B-59395 TaxID=644548 RepID=F1YFG6_9ACTN|nr:sensor histidine kinase [Gordonia neofelifaecis]EGD56454.1 histidine kinase [Gordonia neofelifaecis NRRL B-59395]
MSSDHRTDRYAEWGGHVLFVTLLAIGLRQALAGQAPIAVGGDVAVVVGTVVVGGWYLFGAITVTRRKPSVRAGWVLALTAGWVALVLLSPGFVWVAFVLAMLCWRFLTIPLSVVAEIVIAATSVSATLLHTPDIGIGGIIGPVIGICTAAAVTEVYGRVSRMVDERDDLIGDLIATRERLAQQEREAGTLAERERLGDEIHDGTGQALASIVLLLRAATSPDTPEDQRGLQIETALDTAQTALAESRRFLRGLHGSDLEPDGLTDALSRAAAQQSVAGLPTVFEVHGTPQELPAQARHALLRVAQESLTNVAKHAEARRAVITLTHLPGEIYLDVSDDGRGFDPGAVDADEHSGSGRGLHTMRRRMSEAGGTVTVESRPGDGAVVHARIRLDEAK